MKAERLPFSQGTRPVLVGTGQRIELREHPARTEGAVWAEFVAGRFRHRLRFGGRRSQALARAIGWKGEAKAPAVVDATAGLGRDAFLLAWLGCRVTAVERSPAVWLLLRDGLLRAARDPELAPAVERLTLLRGEARALLPGLAARRPAEVVCLDPMHPPRRSGARVRKEMHLLRQQVGGDEDAGRLFLAARAAATARVVVKRPLHAPALAAEPDFVLRGRSTRFDVYLAGSRKEVTEAAPRTPSREPRPG